MKILAIIVQFLRWLASRNELAATPEGQATAKAEREKAEAAKVQGEVDRAQKAVTTGDADEVNKTLRKNGLLILVVMLALCSGCAGKVVYIERDDAAVRYELNGKKGWFVPDATMARLMEQAIRNSGVHP